LKLINSDVSSLTSKLKIAGGSGGSGGSGGLGGWGIGCGLNTRHGGRGGDGKGGSSGLTGTIIVRTSIGDDDVNSDVFYNTNSLGECTKKLIYDSWHTNQGLDMSTYSSWATTSTCCIMTRSELKVHVDQWIVNSTNHPCGEVIGDWDVSRVTDMSYLFCGLNKKWTPFECDSSRQSFNGNISGWDTSKVTTLEGTFMGTTSFKGDISQWDVSQVTTFERQTFTMFKPLDDACTKENARLTVKEGVSIVNAYWGTYILLFFLFFSCLR